MELVREDLREKKETNSEKKARRVCIVRNHLAVDARTAIQIGRDNDNAG